MNTPLQDKDDQWRNRRANGATPVFDPGMSPPGSDAEAGGAAGAVADDRPTAAGEPLPSSPDRNAPGLVLTPRVWFIAAGALALLFVVAGWISFK